MAKRKLGSVKAVSEVLITSADLAADVTGILPVANGGTGQSTFTDGQLLIGNTTGNTLAKASLTPGTGISVTPGAGSISIAVAAPVVRTDQVNTYSTGVRQVFAPNSTDPGLIVGSTATDPSNVYDGGIWFNSTSLDLKYGDNGVVRTVVNTNETQTLTGKTISGASNTLSVLGSQVNSGSVSVSNGGTGASLSATGGTGQYVKQASTGAAFTVGVIPVADLPALNGFTDTTPALDDRVPIYDTSATANRDAAVAEIVGAGVEGFIQGCKLEYNTTTQIRVTPGMAYIQSSGKILKLAANDDTSPSLSASTWYHVYLFDNSGTVDTEVSTTAPASPWIGTARSKTSDTTRRYLGSFRTNASSQIQNFQQSGGGALVQVAWRVDTGVVTRALSGGTASTATNISLANYVPPTCFLAFVRAINLGDQAVFTDTSDCTGTNVAASSGLLALGNGAQAFLFHPLNSSQTMRYAFAPAPSTGAFYLDVYGFLLER
jgi:hypothetical protein